MIEFNGQPSFEVQKHIYKKTRRMLHIAFSIAWFVLLFPIAFFTIVHNMTLFLYGYLAMLPVLYSIVFACQPSRKKPMLPGKLTIDNEYIEYKSRQATVCRNISDVKVVRDYGDFYDVISYFGKGSDFFVCQKSLLSCGTLEAFEKLFSGKIVRMDKLSK